MTNESSSVMTLRILIMSAHHKKRLLTLTKNKNTAVNIQLTRIWSTHLQYPFCKHRKSPQDVELDHLHHPHYRHSCPHHSQKASKVTQTVRGCLLEAVSAGLIDDRRVTQTPHHHCRYHCHHHLVPSTVEPPLQYTIWITEYNNTWTKRLWESTRAIGTVWRKLLKNIKPCTYMYFIIGRK